MRSVCVATSYDSAFRGIGIYSEMTFRAYAKLHGHSIHVDHNPGSGRPPSWHRIKLIPRLFDRGFDYVLWLDADALFSRFDQKIDDLITDEHDLYIVRHDHRSFATRVPNAGVMLWRNSAWSRQQLSRIWEMEQYVDHVWWENAALIKLLGYNSLLGDGEDDFAQDLLEHVKFIDDSWNYIPSVCFGDDPIIRHYAGCTESERLKEIPRRALESVLRPAASTTGKAASFIATFDNQYAARLGRRADGFRTMFSWLEQRGQSSYAILETGCCRVQDNWAGDGQSTLLFDAFVSHHGGSVVSIDLSIGSVMYARSVTSSLVHLICADSVSTIATLRSATRHEPAPFDLIYLDSYDVDFDDWQPAALHHVKELLALGTLRSGTLVCVDDNIERDGEWVGKGGYIKSYFDDIGVKMIHRGYQFVWEIP